VDPEREAGDVGKHCYPTRFSLPVRFA
jgi:hypothetical protein